jgi:hypothetical protein
MSGFEVYSTDGPRVYPEGRGDDLSSLIDRLSSVPPWANVYYDGEDGLLLHRFEALNEAVIDRFDNYYLKTRLGPEDGIQSLGRWVGELSMLGWETHEDDGSPVHPERLSELTDLDTGDFRVDDPLQALLAQDETLRWDVPDIRSGYAILARIVDANLEASVVIAEDVEPFEDLGDVLVELGDAHEITPRERTADLLQERRAETEAESVDEAYEHIEDAIQTAREAVDPFDGSYDEVFGLLVVLERVRKHVDAHEDDTLSEASDAVRGHPVVRTALDAESTAETFETVDLESFHERVADLVERHQRGVLEAYLGGLDDDSEDPDQRLEDLQTLRTEFVADAAAEEGRIARTKRRFLGSDDTPSWAALDDQLDEMESACREAVVAHEADRVDEALDDAVDRLAGDHGDRTAVRRQLLDDSSAITTPGALRASISAHPWWTLLGVVVLVLIAGGLVAAGVLARPMLPI